MPGGEPRCRRGFPAVSRWSWGSGNPRWRLRSPARRETGAPRAPGARRGSHSGVEPRPACAHEETALGRGAPPGRTGGSSPRAHGSPGGAVCVGWSAGSCSARRRLPGTGEGSRPPRRAVTPALSVRAQSSIRKVPQGTEQSSKTFSGVQEYQQPPPPKKILMSDATKKATWHTKKQENKSRCAEEKTLNQNRSGNETNRISRQGPHTHYCECVP